MMKMFVYMMLILSVLIPGAAQAGALLDEALPREQVQVYLLIGQSNMAGRGRYAEGDKLPDRTYVLNGSDRFEVMAYPFVNEYSTIRKSAAQISPGYGFAHEAVKTLSDRAVLALVSNARGGSSICEWARGGHYYEEAVRRTREALKYGELKAILWHQGETDGDKPAFDYLSALEQLIADLRADLKAPQVPFIAGEVFRNAAVINPQLAQLPDRVPCTAVVSAEGLITVDGAHFDRSSVLELGKRYADKVKELLP